MTEERMLLFTEVTSGEGESGDLLTYDHNAKGLVLFRELFDGMERDLNATTAFNEAEAEYVRISGSGIGRDFQYDFIADNGVKIRVKIYRSGVAVYGTTSISFEELESARPYKISISDTSLDFSDKVNFSAGDLTNNPAAEVGFREALDHFFKPKASLTVSHP